MRSARICDRWGRPASTPRSRSGPDQSSIDALPRPSMPHQAPPHSGFALASHCPQQGGRARTQVSGPGSARRTGLGAVLSLDPLGLRTHMCCIRAHVSGTP
eukprot:8767936-Alexandrium_andersonii.AAC.1